MAQSASERRKAQRVLAKARKQGKSVGAVPESVKRRIRSARENYARDVIAGKEPYPAKGSLEARNLASLAAKARWGKAPKEFESAFKRYWYHKDDNKQAEEIEDELDAQNLRELDEAEDE